MSHIYIPSVPLYIYRERGRDRDRETERQRQRQRQTDRHRQTQTDTEREAERVGYTEGGTLRRLLLSSNYRSWLRWTSGKICWRYRL